jgi:capsular polysaccharide transport system permease protein
MNATDQSHPVTEWIPHENWADLIAVRAPESPAAIKPPATRRLWLIRAGLFALPLLMALAVTLLLPPSYVSETSFLLRHQAASTSLPASGTEFDTASDSANPDAYAVRDFLLSRDAMRQIGQNLGGQNLGGQNFAGATNAARYADFRRRVSVDLETSSGVLTLRARAGSPQQAHDLATALVQQAGGLVTRFNQASATSDYLAPLAQPSLPDAPERENRQMIWLAAAGIGAALAWSKRA